MVRSTPLYTVFVTALVVAGCTGSGKMNTKGVILKDGGPLKVGPEDVVRVVLVPMPEDGSNPHTLFAAEFNPDKSTFIVKGPDGRGMPPGKYRVAVELLQGRKDVFKGAFSSENSPLICTIQSSSDEIKVDVGKGK
jgi:hypothetical protein